MTRRCSNDDLASYAVKIEQGKASLLKRSSYTPSVTAAPRPIFTSPLATHSDLSQAVLKYSQCRFRDLDGEEDHEEVVFLAPLTVPHINY